MRGRTTLIAALLLAALGVYVWLYEIRGAAGREEEERRAGLVLGVAASDVTALRIDRAGTTVLVRRDGDAWRLAEPIDAPGDRTAIEEIVNSLADLRRERALEGIAAADRQSFGLEPPAATAVLTLAGGGERRLALGGRTAVKANRYVESDGAVSVVAATLSRLEEATVESLRDRALVHLPKDDLDAIALQRASGGELRLRRQGERWRIEHPESLPAHRSWSSDLLFAITSLRALGFLDTPGSPAPVDAGLATPSVRVLLTATDGRTESIAIGAVTPAGATPAGRYARAGEGPLAVVDSALHDAALAGPETWRDPRPLDLERWDLQRIQSAGPVTLELKRASEGGAWSRTTGGAVSEEISRALLDQLADAEATGFAPPGPLAEPVLTLTLEGRDGATQVLRCGAEGASQPTRLQSDRAGLLYLLPAGAGAKLLEALRSARDAPAPESAPAPAAP